MLIPAHIIEWEAMLVIDIRYIFRVCLCNVFYVQQRRDYGTYFLIVFVHMHIKCTPAFIHFIYSFSFYLVDSVLNVLEIPFFWLQLRLFQAVEITYCYMDCIHSWRIYAGFNRQVHMPFLYFVFNNF